MTLERYIIRNHIGPFLFSLAMITFVFVMNFILRYIDLFLNKGVEFHIVLQTFILSLGYMFAMIIPMSVLPATIMTFGNFAAENEITAMKASGISIYRMILPAFLVASLLTVGMILYNDRVLPESNHRLANLLTDIYKKQPTVKIEPNVVVDDFQGYKIFVREKNDKTGEVGGVRIFEHDSRGVLVKTVTAERGKLDYLEKDQILRFELENAQIHEMPKGNDPSTYRWTEMRNYTTNIRDDKDRTFQRSERPYRSDREMSVGMMKDKIISLRGDIAAADTRIADMAREQVIGLLALLDPAVRDSLLAGTTARPTPPPSRTVTAQPRPMLEARTADGVKSGLREVSMVTTTRKALETQKEMKDSYLRQIDRYRVEIEKKYSIPVACIVFVLMGSPIAIRLGRSGMNTAIALSVLVFLVYYVCLIGGEKLADRQIVSPMVAMWSPNVLFGIVGVLLARSATLEHRPVRFRVPKRLGFVGRPRR
jgi:lipopolysaccharide export system permease protein